jgi:hypothetical protein
MTAVYGWLIFTVNAILRAIGLLYLRVSVRGHVVNWSSMAIAAGVVAATCAVVRDMLIPDWGDLLNGAVVIIVGFAMVLGLKYLIRRAQRRANHITRTSSQLVLMRRLADDAAKRARKSAPSRRLR